MSDYKLTRTRINAGLYEGFLTTSNRRATKPALEMRLLDQTLGEVVVTPHISEKKCWDVRAIIPTGSIHEGVQTFILSDTGSGTVLDSFAIATGTPLEEDLRAEIALLRAELDMLKHAFRRHCVETT